MMAKEFWDFDSEEGLSILGEIWFSLVSSFHLDRCLEIMVCNLGYTLKSPREYCKYKYSGHPPQPHQLNAIIFLNFSSVVVEKMYLSGILICTSLMRTV